MSDAPVGVSWQLPDYSIFGTFVCSLYIMYFQQSKWFLINLLLTTCMLFLDLLIDISYVLLCI